MAHLDIFNGTSYTLKIKSKYVLMYIKIFFKLNSFLYEYSIKKRKPRTLKTPSPCMYSSENLKCGRNISSLVAVAQDVYIYIFCSPTFK